MSTPIQPFLGGTFPRNHHPASRPDSCAGALPLAEQGATGIGAFSPWLARARSARMLTEHL